MNTKAGRFAFVYLFILALFPLFFFGQAKPKKQVFFNQNKLNAYKFDQNTYDLRTKDSFSYLQIPGDSTTFFFDPSAYKGILNYGVDFALKDKRNFTFIENYNVYYNEVVFESCVFSPHDSIVEIQGRVEGGWNTVDFNGGPPPDFVEVAVGKLQKSTYVVHLNMNHYNNEKLTTTYKGEEKTISFPLDTLNTMVFERLDYTKRFAGNNSFKIRFKANKNSVLTIGKLASFVHFYDIGALVFGQQKKAAVVSPKREKDAPRFKQIIANNKQMNDPKNQVKTALHPYYQLTEKAETCILTKQYGKAKAIYAELAANHPTVYARDMHNAIRVSILARDVNGAFEWGEKLAAKGIGLPYFDARIFNAMKKNPQWKSFAAKYDSLSKAAQSRWNVSLKQQMMALLEEDQADYGLENRKESQVLYETTQRVTAKLLALLKAEGYPSEEKIGAFTRKDTILIQSPEFLVVIRHAVQQKPKALAELNEVLNENAKNLEFDLQRLNTHRNFPGSCFHIYKGNLYIAKSCDYNSDAMVRRMVFMFNNPHGFIMDNGEYIISEYNPESPEQWDKYYQNGFNLVTKLTDDWEFYEK